MKKKQIVLLCPLLLWMQPVAASVLLDEVVVTASRVEESRKQVSAAVRVIDHEEIAQSAAATVGELLAQTGAAQVRQYPGGLTAVGLRGFSTDTHGNDLQGHVLILLDGRRAGTGNAAKLLTDNVERIEIIRGPGAVQYGSAGMGGVINIITRQGEKNALAAEAGAGSFDAAAASLSGTWVKEHFDFAGSVSRSEQGDYETGSGQLYGNTASSETGLSLNAGWSFTKENRVGLIITASNLDDAGNPGYLASNDLDDRTDKENWSADLSWRGKGSQSQQWLVRYFLGKDNNSWLDPAASDPDGWDDGSVSENTTKQQGGQAQFTSAFGLATVTAGADWLYYEVENTWTPQETSYSNPALFLLGRTSLLKDRLSLDAGLRYDWYSTEMEEPAGRSHDDSHFTPQVGLTWLATDALKLRARYAQGFVLPSADQLGADFSRFGTRTVGNPALAPEQSTTYEAGLDFSQGFFQAALTYFHTDFEDKIIVAPLPDSTRSWQNLGDAVISGLEGQFSHDLGLLLNWSWSVRPYLNLTVLTQYENKSTGEDLEQVSGSTLAAGLAADDGGRLSFRLNVACMGRQLVEDWQSEASPRPLVELDSSMVADLTAAWRFYEDPIYGAFSLRGRASNLLDEDYAYVKGYPLPGRSLFLSLRWEY
ncbi:TonB-dependent receptor [Candidatus Electronema halotolerans]